MAGKSRRRARLRFYYLLLLLPLAALWVPLYNRLDPTLAGIPFFYWVQMAWIVLTVLVIYTVHRCERRDGGQA